MGENAEGRLLLLPVLGGAQHKEPESSATYSLRVAPLPIIFFIRVIEP